MINFYPQKVPFFKALKLLFTRRVWLAVHIDEVGQPIGAQVGYDKPKGALPLTPEVIEQQRQQAITAQQEAVKAYEVAAADEQQQQGAQAPKPLYSTRYASPPPPKNRQQRREERRGRK
ncbi:hypothetical protein [Paenibacillus sp. L3-i20]|uniref:hypothetical protein n=1 Tax=Paenibacillus sp. L3-i20 TaxID=2905833 RepID=UPI001EDDE7FF|nr:hypothetical protein [Paenibacillus sp. L3-i20]GKU79329.1 hypothetical protein L3i20_v237260 [Paenibacillus sp. L3-i20]